MKPGGLAAIILAKKPPKGIGHIDNDDGEDDDDSMRYEDASSELLEAIDGKNAGSLGKALKSFVKMCMDEETKDI